MEIGEGVEEFFLLLALDENGLDGLHRQFIGVDLGLFAHHYDISVISTGRLIRSL
jgi:hypothetical protein